jgi:hypothetical protein
MSAAAGPIPDNRYAAANLIARAWFGVAALVLLMLTQFWSDLHLSWGPGVSTIVAYLFFVVHLVLCGRRVSALDPVVWVPVSMLLFYFGMPIAVEVLFADPAPTYAEAWHLDISPNLNRGFCGLLMAFVAFLWGIHLAGITNLSRPYRGDRSKDLPLALPAFVMMLGGMAMVAFGIALVGPSVVFGNYGDWWEAKAGGADARFVDMGILFAMSGVFGTLASDNPRAPLRRYFALGCAAVLAVVLIMKGDRSDLIALGMGTGWCYTQRIKRVRGITILAVFLFVVSAVPMLKEFRDYRSVEESSRTSVRNLWGSALYELGSSANAFVYTLDLVPSRGGYLFGLTYVEAVLEAIPNFGLKPGKSFVFFGGPIQTRFGLRLSPSAWITKELNPIWYENAGGYGFTMAGEWYYNFGMFAVVPGMALMGYLLVRMRNASVRSAMRLAASAMLLGAMAIYVRNIIAYPLKMATWPIFGLFVIRGIFSMLAPARPIASGALDHANGTLPIGFAPSEPPRVNRETPSSTV